MSSPRFMLRSHRHQSPHIMRLEDRRLMSVIVRPLSHFDEFAVPPLTNTRTAARLAGITAGADGNMWFTDPDAQAVGRITPRGVVTEFHVNEIGPRGIVAGPDGSIWVTAGEPFVSPALIRITPAGQVTDFLMPDFHHQPEHVTIGSDGNLWFTEFVYPTFQAIGRMTPSGQLTEFPYPTPGLSSDPEGIAAGRDGSLYFAHNGLLARVSTDGQVTDRIGAAGLGVAAGPDGNIWSVGTLLNQDHTQILSAYVERVTLNGVATRFELPS